MINSSARYLKYISILTAIDGSYTPYLFWINVTYAVPVG